jgi:hypothetical protein
MNAQKRQKRSLKEKYDIIIVKYKNRLTTIEESDNDIESIPQEIVSSSQAFNALNILQKHFCQIGNNSMNSNFCQIQNILTQNLFKSLKQLKITDFMK